MVAFNQSFSPGRRKGPILIAYYGFRYYDPVTGRWPSRDPITEKAFVTTHVSNQLSAELNHAKMKISQLQADIMNAMSSYRSGIPSNREALKAAFIGRLKMQRIVDELSSILPVQAGINGYQFVGNQALNFYDILGMHKGDQHFGHPQDFWRWYHRQVKRPGDPDLTKDEADDLFEEWEAEGKPNPEGSITEPAGSGECEIDEEEPDGLLDAFLIGAGVGAGAALIGGQLGPQAAAPEEIVTVPVGAVVGGFVGLFRFVF